MAETKEERLERAKVWLDKAIAAGMEPMIFISGSEETFGTRRPEGGNWPPKEQLPGAFPHELWDELHSLMAPIGRVRRAVVASEKEVANV